jgi:hypothetical protein
VIETALRRLITKHNPIANLNTVTNVLYSNNNNTNSLTESIQGTAAIETETETNDTTNNLESDIDNTNLTDLDNTETSNCTT